MPVTTDLLNSTLADLQGPLDMTFAVKTTIYKDLFEKGKVSSVRGTLIERPIMAGAPSSGTGVFGGGETLDLGRTENTHKIQVQTHRIVVPVVIPKLEMLQNEGKAGVIRLVEVYPKAVLEAIPVAVDRYLFTGVSGNAVLPTAALGGWNSLNGAYTATGGKIGVTNGLIAFAAPTAQSDTVQNLAKSNSIGYVNQFGEVTDFPTDGKRVLRKVWRDCSAFNMTGPDAGPDVIYMDFDSFAKFEEEDEAKVQIAVVGDKTDKGNTVMTRLSLGNARVQAAKHIVLTDFTGDAAEGLTYMLTTAGWEWVWFQKPTLSKFEEGPANQDIVVAKYEMMGAPIVTGLRMQGAVVGTARGA